MFFGGVEEFLLMRRRSSRSRDGEGVVTERRLRSSRGFYFCRFFFLFGRVFVVGFLRFGN